jgi:hypothetical protein
MDMPQTGMDGGWIGQLPTWPKDLSRVSGRQDSRILQAKLPAIPMMRVWVQVPESQKVHRILSGIPGESGI